MRRLTGLALRGLAVALPFTLTLYFVHWSISNIEWAMRYIMPARIGRASADSGDPGDRARS